jgi:hypothetical protein
MTCTSVEYSSCEMSESVMLYMDKWMEFGVVMMLTTSQSLIWSDVESGLTMDMMMIIR